jgi:hypothetical protein
MSAIRAVRLECGGDYGDFHQLTFHVAPHMSPFDPTATFKRVKPEVW